MIRLKRCIIVLVGLSFAGKSTLLKKLARTTNLVPLDVDRTRQECYPGRKWLGQEGEKEVMLISYTRNHQKAQAALEAGKPVLLAATYSREIYHEMLRDLGTKTDAPILVFFLTFPESLVTERIEKRLKIGSDSNLISYEAYQLLKNRYQLIQGVNLRQIDTSQPIDLNIREILTFLKEDGFILL
jgi:predicted kinase